MSKKNTMKNYEFVLRKFQHHFGDIELNEVRPEDILKFLNTISMGTKPSTKRLRFSLLAAFFTYIQESLDPNFKNPCRSQALRKLFRAVKPAQIKILEKEIVDEIIFRSTKPRNRLILELMARSGMRVGEVLKLTPADVDGRKVTIQDPKSGTEAEVAFLPQKVADRLRDYIQVKNLMPSDRIFPISYAGARLIVKNAGDLVGVSVRPHDLRRRAATYASRSGTPLEIISKVLLRHSNLSTTQRYLGKISDAEAIQWMDNLHG